jgi:hypothetical protein
MSVLIAEIIFVVIVGVLVGAAVFVLGLIWTGSGE